MSTNIFVKHSTFKKQKKTLFNYVISLFLLSIILAMLFYPEKYITVALNSLLVWATVVLPAIFPFLLYAKFLTKFELIDFFSKKISPVTKVLFNTDGVSAFIYLVSIISGYPIGAKLTADFFNDGRISRGNAFRTITYCANSGPMFIIGTVGIGMFLSKTAGYVILISHILGAVLNGVLYRKYKINDNFYNKISNKKESDDDFLYQTAISSCNSMLIVGTYIVVFFILIEFLSTFLIANNSLTAVFNGLFEITHGCQDLSILSISLNLKTILATFVITFGGLSTILQSLAFLKKMKLSISFFVLIKFTHAIFSTIICFLILIFFKL